VPDRCFNVLFLCTGNSARSIMAEAILNKSGIGRFRAYSAGSHPKGQVHPEAVRLLNDLGYDTANLRSKSWTEFSRFGAPRLDFVFTVCDNAAGEMCPIWPGRPTTAHWGIPDPAKATGSPTEVPLAFHDAFRMLHRRLSAFAALPLRSLDKVTLRAELREIGQMADAAEPH
jgi:protein-tyrosine-phosphatase